MPLPCALFVDLRYPIHPEMWPHQPFAMAYIVTGTLDQTQDFFKTHHTALATIPHITCEITQSDTLHLLTRIPSVTRLSLPHDQIVVGLADHFALDAMIQWDHRRNAATYHDQIDQALANGATHISLYGLQDFALWQDTQTFLQQRGLRFYERFHAARPGQESRYQNHLAQFGDVIAINGWSRLNDGHTTRVKSPRQREFVILDRQSKREEQLLLGLSNRHGLPLTLFSRYQLDQAVASHLAVIVDNRLRPTDAGLWDTVKLVTSVA